MEIHNTLSSDQYLAPIWDEKQEDAITYLEDTLRLLEEEATQACHRRWNSLPYYL